MLQYFRDLAHYNRWANERLYKACGKLTAEEYHQIRPAFFKSIHGTLNHLLLADQIWLGRITGAPSEYTALDIELHKELNKLERARRTFDEEIVDFAEELKESELQKEIRYRTISQPDRETITPLSRVLAHFFNHQTHHRGQVHDLLSQTSVAPPPLDLIQYFRGR